MEGQGCLQGNKSESLGAGRAKEGQHMAIRLSRPGISWHRVPRPKGLSISWEGNVAQIFKACPHVLMSLPLSPLLGGRRSPRL